MAKRKTIVLLRIAWDDNDTDHPVGWDWKTLVWGDPFSREGSRDVSLVSTIEENTDRTDRIREDNRGTGAD